MGDIDAVVDPLLATAMPHTAEEREFLATNARELMERRREYLDKLSNTSDKYPNTLLELDTADDQLIELSQVYAAFIDR